MKRRDQVCKRQRGVALFTALLVVALAAVLLAMMFDTGETTMARTRNTARGEQADQYALGLEAWAKDLLGRDYADDPSVDSRSDLWANPLPITEVPGGKLFGVMRDLGGCFNLNNLVVGAVAETAQVNRFRRLLIALKLDADLADAVVDWIDADFEPQSHGAEDTQYLLATPGYRTANRRMGNITELRLVRGIDAEIFRRLAPHVCALPETTELNVNTATVPVLMSLDDSISASVAQRLYDDGHARHPSRQAFLDEVQKQGAVIGDPRGLDTKSGYFLAQAEIELDGVPIAYASLIQRRPGGMSVIARMRGRADF